MTNNISEEFKPIEELSELLPSANHKKVNAPRFKISKLLLKHYGFRLPENCNLVISTHGNLLLFVDHGKFGKVRMKQITNCPYFKYISMLEDKHSKNFVYFVFILKSGFKKDYLMLKRIYGID
jgi:hypothetical protein